MADFRYWNENPSFEHRNDCVTRAITLASGLPYAEIRRKLRNTASLLDCESSLCPTCYGFLIQEVLGGVPKDCNGMTVEEFADNYPIGTFLVRMNGHISTVIDNCIYDIFDCRKHLLTNAWQM
jgi:hypothetical protein